MTKFQKYDGVGRSLKYAFFDGQPFQITFLIVSGASIMTQQQSGNGIGKNAIWQTRTEADPDAYLIKDTPSLRTKHGQREHSKSKCRPVVDRMAHLRRFHRRLQLDQKPIC